MKRLSLGLVASLLVLGVTTASAQRKDTDTAVLVLNPPAGARLAEGGLWPLLGDTVTFSATYPKQLEQKGVRVQVLCYQNGEMVFAISRAWNVEFVLGGGWSPWRDAGGAATCNADLYYWSYNGGQKFNFLANTQFEVGAR